ncbi:MAG: DUF1049 domain-containing protein [Firmicutes bacterium]|nr:DUF1049 domain-containing protein [Bacillota bacterium]
MKRRGEKKMQIYFVLGMVFALIVAIFAVQNATAVDLSFLGWSFPDISLVLVILTSVAGGALITVLFGLPRQIRTMMRVRELTAENQRLNNEMKKVNNEDEKTNNQESETSNANKSEQ